MYWICCTTKTSVIDNAPLTEKDKKRLYKLSLGSDNSFLQKLNRKEVDYLLSMVDRQDAQSSYIYAAYVRELDIMDKKLV